MLELVFRGLHDGFREMGFETGRNLELRQSHAQGEMVNIPQILTNYDSQDLDLIMTWTTPVLTAACNTVKSKRLVFTLVSDPIAAGAGRSATDHLPFLTGVGMFPPVSEMIELIQDVIPGVRSVGTLYNDAEANSRKVVSVGRELFRKRGLRLEEVTVTAIGEVHQAAQVLAARNIQAFWISGDNTADGALDSILQVAQDRRLPVFLEDPDFIKRGALAGLGKGSYEAGYAGARLAARVLLGENPRDLPFEEVSKVILSVNEDAAKRLGIRFPEKVLKAAKR
jgi:putative ABC transport system substrate-binding protein